jgi:uncharacterized protein YciW
VQRLYRAYDDARNVLQSWMRRRGVVRQEAFDERVGDSHEQGYCGLDGAHIAAAHIMVIGRDALRHEYQTRLTYWLEELQRVAPGDKERADQIRRLIQHYTQQIGELEHPRNAHGGAHIGAGPTLGGDGKPNIDC